MTKLTILLLEDSPLTANALAIMVREFGYEVAGVAASGEEALQLFEDTRPDLAILDIRVKGEMDGVAVGQAISKRRPIPIIYVTAYSEEYYEKAKITHPAAFFSKPYNERDLRNAIDLALYNFAQNTTPQQSASNTSDQSLAHIHFRPNSLWIKNKNGAFERLPISEIRWVEADNVYLNIYTDAHKKPYVLILGLQAFLQYGKYPELKQAHRSYIVNIRHITGFSNTEVTIEGTRTVPLSKTHAPTVIDALLNARGE